ncbi:glucan endo-1,3-beta-glucosidase 14-like [Nymphaea colorata]|uniref:glucan endo-1,3-beta-glucosidase 14-like n=1 Tax=Nymphaea colorata TaxID=210225 RepID=UPI00129DD7E7|nr:glucan endo-1,3-beta-glucosidase 14-like [Nymphaea colorata]
MGFDSQCRWYRLAFLLLSGVFFSATASPPAVGINYGQLGNNLPSPDRVVGLLQSINVSKVKLYDSDPQVLHAFRNTSIEFVIGIPNDDVGKMTDPAKAYAWVKANVLAYLPQTRVSCITVGNEVLTGNDSSLIQNLVPAMQNVYNALRTLRLANKVQVTTAHSLAVLQSSYPPSTSSFRQDLVKPLRPLLDFHARTGSPFLINAYPFFAYMGDPKNVPLDYVLFQPNAGNTDPNTGLHYDNMLFAQIDAVHSALEAEGHHNLTVKVSETGWPSKGDAQEVGATPGNARAYNGNLMKIAAQRKGTPKRPNSPLEVYVFALFNENMKPGPTSERNYGLFKPDGTPSYAVGLDSARLGSASPPADQSPTPFNTSVVLPPTQPATGAKSANSSSAPSVTSVSSAVVLRWGSMRLLGQGLVGLVLACMCFFP